MQFPPDFNAGGIIMYAMCNGGKIPFESDSCDRKKACEERFSGKAVTAPSEGDEKLKSVIVIACQPDNANRWKNAGNIKNALTSIKAENGASSPAPNPEVVVPESTDFDGNVFEEYDYDEFEDTEPTEPQDNFDAKDEVQTVDDAVLDNEFGEAEQLSIDGVLNQEEPLPVAENASVEAEDTAESDENDDEGGFEVVDVTDAVDEPENSEVKTDEVSEEKQPEFEDISSVSSKDDNNEQTVTDKKAEEFEDVSSNSEVAPEVLPPVTSVEVFDDYSGADHKNVLTSNESSKDYGDFFEDEPSVKPADNKADGTKKVGEKTSFDDNSFEDDDNEFGYTDKEENVKKKKNKFIIVLCAVVIAAALGFIGFCVYNGLSNSSTDNKTTTAETATSAEVTTQAPSTAMPTTVPATTEQVTTSSSYNNVVPVVGYGYSYGKKLLEQAGFTVEISDYEYSYDYPEGYIISQTPEGDTSASTGTVVKLVISSGQIQRETEAPATQAQQSSNSQNSSSGNSNSQSSNAQSSSNTNTNNNGGFIFPNSDSSYLSNAQVSALSDNDLQLAINEIYARRGRIFKDASLNAYFNSQSWYEGKYTAEEFEKNVKFNTYEQKNLQLLINERRSRK